MKTSLRDQVLGRLGITQWYGKYSLPTVIDSPCIIFNVSDEEHALELVSNVSILENNVSATKVKSAEALGFVNRADPSTKDDSVDNAAIDEVLNQAVTAYFGSNISLVKVKIGRYDVVYDSVGGDGVIPSSNKFLRNVFELLNPEAEIGESEYSVLSYPVFESKSLLREQSIHSKSLIARWLESIISKELEGIFYIGEHVSLFKELMTDSGSKMNSLYFGHPLAEIMVSGLKKKELWRYLFNSEMIGS